jgi:hypothetical protein
MDWFVATGTRVTELLPSTWTSATVRCYSGFQAVFPEPLPSHGHIRHNMYYSILNTLGRSLKIIVN